MRIGGGKLWGSLNESFHQNHVQVLFDCLEREIDVLKMTDFDEKVVGHDNR